MSDKSNIVIIHFLNHKFAREHRRANIDGLSMHCRVICIEPPVTLLSLLCRFGDSLSSLLNLQLRRIPDSSVELFRPLMPFPYALAYRWDLATKINRWFLFHSLNKVRQEIQGKKKIVFVTCPQHSCVLNTIGEDLLCYDCCDAYSKDPRQSARARLHLHAKNIFLASQSNIVFVTSSELFRQMVVHNICTFYIPNSADTSFFERAMKSIDPIPDDLCRIPKPWLGLIGFINELVDVELLNALAERQSDWSFVIIGEINGGYKFRNSSAVKKFLRLQNVFMIGYKPYTSVPFYQKWLDVCLICYKRNEYTDCIHPNKLSQYLSQHKEIVSTAIKELQNYSNMIRVAKTTQEFEAAVAEALQKKYSPQITPEVAMYLFNNTVQKATIKKLEIITEYLGNIVT